MIKCLSFDLDDTFWDIRPVIANMDVILYQWLASNAPAYTAKFALDHYALLRREVVDNYPQIAHSVTDVRIKCLQLGLARAGYSEKQVARLAAQGFAVSLEARQQVDYFPHVWRVLDQLREQGYLMGAITNGNADIHKVGLSQHFDFQFNAHEVGVEKPHPAIFQAMLAHTNLRPEQVIHIGDNPIADIQGAQQLGMATIWGNVITQPWNESFSADQSITCISELPSAVQQIVAERYRHSTSDN